MTYRILALDMDGTLLNGDKKISEANRYWIGRAIDAGVNVCMATGRGRPSIVPYLAELGLHTPFVAVNGSEVWRDTDSLHERILLDKTVFKELHRIAVAYDTWFWAYGVTQVYNKENWTRDIDAEDWMKFCYYSEDESILAEIAEKIRGLGSMELTNSDPKNIEINPPGVTKASGLRQLCALMGCGMEDVLAAGDSLNDMAMIREAGLGVAMGNAQDAVKAAAGWIAPTNDEDGVAAIIRRYLMEVDGG